jgi:hypothetical protein
MYSVPHFSNSASFDINRDASNLPVGQAEGERHSLRYVIRSERPAAGPSLMLRWCAQDK